jgi:hypothetical protein
MKQKTNPTMIYYIDQSYMKPSEKTSVPERPKYIKIKHYTLRDEVQKREGGSPIYISTDEKVCVLKLELVETTSLLKKEDMTPRLGGSTDVLLIYGQSFFKFKKWSRMSSSFSVRKVV